MEHSQRGEACARDRILAALNPLGNALSWMLVKFGGHDLAESQDL